MKNGINRINNSDMFINLSNNELCNVTGGAVLGVILGAANGYGIGLVCALIGSCTTSNWTYQDTKNMMNTGATVGAFIGGFLPA